MKQTNKNKELNLNYKEMIFSMKNLETGNVRSIKKNLRMNIFQPTSVTKETRLRTVLLWFLKMTEPCQNRYQRMHKIFKPYLAYPLLKLVKWVIGKKHMIKNEDILKNWYNNYIRIHHHCAHEAVDGIWERIILHKFKPKERNKRLKSVKERLPSSYMFRKFFMDLWTTEMLEDTADRQWCNEYVLRLTHEVMMLHGLTVEEREKVPLPDVYPAFTSKTAFQPNFFIENGLRAVWKSPVERKKALKEEKKKQKENGKNKTKKS